MLITGTIGSISFWFSNSIEHLVCTYKCNKIKSHVRILDAIRPKHRLHQTQSSLHTQTDDLLVSGTLESMEASHIQLQESYKDKQSLTKNITETYLDRLHFPSLHFLNFYFAPFTSIISECLLPIKFWGSLSITIKISATSLFFFLGSFLHLSEQSVDKNDSLILDLNVRNYLHTSYKADE